MAKITLITGGARSGKSDYALRLATGYEENRIFIATSEPFDEEMKKRIEKHREERGDLFVTVEEPLDLAKAISSLSEDVSVVVVDCITVWIGNLMHYYGESFECHKRITRFIEVLESPPSDLLIITNEVGMGIIPENRLARRFRDMAGNVNRQIAERASRVILMACGIPLIVKGEK